MHSLSYTIKIRGKAKRFIQTRASAKGVTASKNWRDVFTIWPVICVRSKLVEECLNPH